MRQGDDRKANISEDAYGRSDVLDLPMTSSAASHSLQESPTGMLRLIPFDTSKTLFLMVSLLFIRGKNFCIGFFSPITGVMELFMINNC